MRAVIKNESTTSQVSKTGDADDSINLIFLLNVAVVTLPYQTRYRHMLILISAESPYHSNYHYLIHLANLYRCLNTSYRNVVHRFLNIRCRHMFHLITVESYCNTNLPN